MVSPAVEELVELALDEDLGRGDATSEAIFGPDDPARAQLLAKEDLIVAGLDVFSVVFRRVDPRTEVYALLSDGARVERGTIVAEVAGRARSLLGAERTALNFVQRLSGVATLTSRFVAAVEGTRTRICDTRKTAPGFRELDKRAVKAGGGANHRADLASGILIKDNHIAACGSVRAAVERARKNAPHSLRIEVELTSIDQVEDALGAGAEILLLDNMTPDLVREAVALIGERALVEVSGGVSLQTVRAFAEAGADLVSVGALTHSARAVDLSLEFALEPPPQD